MFSVNSRSLHAVERLWRSKNAPTLPPQMFKSKKFHLTTTTMRWRMLNKSNNKKWRYKLFMCPFVGKDYQIR